MATDTFASRILSFHARLKPPRLPGLGVHAMQPHRDPRVWEVMTAFYTKYFADARPRAFIIGINPGRFGAGTTGIPFTDPVTLETMCGIPNAFPKRRELSAQFIDQVLDRLGGARGFYRRFFITAASPIGFTKGGINCNYYDDPRLQARVTPFIVSSLRAQVAFGARPQAVVLGTGKNHAFLSRLNDQHGFFRSIIAIEHPRFIMQYRRRLVPQFLDRYADALDRVASG